MTDGFKKLLLEHLERGQASLDGIERRLDQALIRASNLEASILEATTHLAKRSPAIAARQVAFDDIDRRLDRIERRLELTN